MPTRQLLCTALQQLALTLFPFAHLPQSSQISAMRQHCCVYSLHEIPFADLPHMSQLSTMRQHRCVYLLHEIEDPHGVMSAWQQPLNLRCIVAAAAYDV